jgi:hypothetical protein
LVGESSNKIESIVRLRGRNAEFYFMNTEKRPDALRIELSEPLRAIGRAGAAKPDAPDASAASESVPDQLSKLASLLQQGLITREEFDQLKARLIASP